MSGRPMGLSIRAAPLPPSPPAENNIPEASPENFRAPFPALSLGLRKPVAQPPFNPETHGLLEGETLEPFVLNKNFAYRSKIFKKKNKNGTVKSVRKVANKNVASGSIYGETKKEALIYQRLQELPDVNKYLLPFEATSSNNSRIYLNFKYVEGEDLISFFNKPYELINGVKVFLSAVKALYWLFKEGKYLHGDVKLDNLFVTPDYSVRLIDLGSVISTSYMSRKDAVYEVNNIINMFLRNDHSPIIKTENYTLDVKLYQIDKSELNKGNIEEFMDTFYKGLIAFIEERMPTTPTKGGKRSNHIGKRKIKTKKTKRKQRRNKANTKKKNK
jgi:serine/threonine protein kinase